MASIIFQSFHKISKTNKMKLFKSNDKNLSNGDQSRDFIYIKDLVDIIFSCIQIKLSPEFLTLVQEWQLHLII